MLDRALQQAKTVAIGGHVRPDGDCVGSCMGLYQYICKCYPNVQVDVYLEEVPDSFHMFEIVNVKASGVTMKGTAENIIDSIKRQLLMQM